MGVSPARWQEVFDTDFPDGLIMTWDDQTDTRYLVPRVAVIGVPDDMPVVRLDTLAVQKSFVAHITGYTVIRRRPTLARVVADGYDTLLVWDGDIPDDLKHVMADDDW